MAFAAFGTGRVLACTSKADVELACGGVVVALARADAPPADAPPAHDGCSKFKAHDKVCIGVEWNPYTTSHVATCGWDGLIKYWQ